MKADEIISKCEDFLATQQSRGSVLTEVVTMVRDLAAEVRALQNSFRPATTIERQSAADLGGTGDAPEKRQAG